MTSIKSYKKNISALWNNYNYVKKYDNYKYSSEDGMAYYLNGRRKVVVEYLKRISHGKKITMLELGFGAGQNTQHFMRFCKKFYGIEISTHQVNFAKKRNKSAVRKGKAKFMVGSMEKKFNIKTNSIDVIVIVGALQYVMDTQKCFKECNRVLKNDGNLIIAQTNTFSINDNITMNKFIVGMSRFFLKEQYQYSHSLTIKSILTETKLKKYFYKYRNSWWMNSWIINSGFKDKWKFKVKRRLYSYSRLKILINKNNFHVLSSCGYPFFYNNQNFISEIIFSFLDIILVNLNKISFFAFFLRHIGSSTMFLCRKKK